MPTSPYFSKDGSPLPGTTTIISRYKESGGLLQWACRTGYEQGFKKERMSLYAKRDLAADVGTSVHALIEWHINGQDGDRPAPPAALSPEDMKRGINGYEQFLRWQERTRLEIFSWEKPLVSERYRYGGTPDALFKFNGDTAENGDRHLSRQSSAAGRLHSAVGREFRATDLRLSHSALLERLSRR